MNPHCPRRPLLFSPSDPTRSGAVGPLWSTYVGHLRHRPSPSPGLPRLPAKTPARQRQPRHPPLERRPPHPIPHHLLTTPHSPSGSAAVRPQGVRQQPAPVHLPNSSKEKT
ncbi:hypothetical protein SCOCK_610038 [Actinacidiphila cocklensis]|uniref:Uncharacterized protein n=1 Tax=Actinacidiphila cocklensis TaxID=887465 RepID=A0A9W4DUN2_9ACTN|nr:hypothetical protein SCOCK_610038 [Actinacidiphila cocklensis]